MNATNSLSIAAREKLKSRPLASLSEPITKVQIIRVAQFYNRDAIQASIGESVRALLAREQVKALRPQRDTIVRCN